MKEGVYIVTENGTAVSVVKFTGTEPFLMLSGSFDVLEFLQTGQTKQLSTLLINDIKTNSNKYAFVLLSEYHETKKEFIKLNEQQTSPKKIQGYREFLEKTGDRIGLIMKIMADQKISHSEATHFLETHIRM